jgi:hypothetical protein
MQPGKIVWLAGVAAVVMLLCAPRANAFPIQYDFHATVTSGPLNGTVEDGTFAYDSSSIIDGGINQAAGILTSLNFTFEGTTYNASTANTGFMIFDAAGNLTSATFGNNCDAGTCFVQPDTNQWWIGGSLLSYATPTSAAESDGGNVTFTLVSAVPEPGSLALLAIAVLGLGFAHRSRGRRFALV